MPAKSTENTQLEGYSTVDEYAEEKGVHRETVKRWLRQEKVKGIKFPGPTWLIPNPDQIAPSCCGCAANPIGPAPILLDSDGNIWHRKCAGVLLAKFIEMRKGHLDAARRLNEQPTQETSESGRRGRQANYI